MKLRAVFIGLVFVLSGLGACKNSMKSSGNSESAAKAVPKIAAENNVVENKIKTTLEAETEKNERQSDYDAANQERIAPKYPDSLYFMIDRTPCLGTCPIYTMNIYKSGWAILDGGKYFDFEGQFTAKFSKEELSQIQKMAMDAGYAEMKHVYDGPVTDLPSTTTILNSEKIQHWVYNRMGSPDELRNFQRSIESLIKEKRWADSSKVEGAEGQD